MLHSKYYKKEKNEDPKTSAVFENLMLLPDDVFWHVIKTSCADNSELPDYAGRLLSYEFWPHWNSEGTDNSNYVEPDLFFRFEMFDVIIEAKYNEHDGQNEHQWKKEVTAYYNEYHWKKDVVFIAVGGNKSMQKEGIEIKGKKINIYKCSWLSLLISVDKHSSDLDNITTSDYHASATRRLLDNITLAFNLNDVYHIEWFDVMARKQPVISPTSLDKLSNFFKIQQS